MPRILPTLKKQYSGHFKPENRVCIRKPQHGVYNIDEERGVHEHPGGVFGFFHCEGELVRSWPKTVRKIQKDTVDGKRRKSA